MQPHTFYLICCTERTGSRLLADTLERLEIAGRPREYFHPGVIAQRSTHNSLAGYRAYLKEVIAEGTTANGVFGATMHWSHMISLAQRLQPLRGVETTYLSAWLDSVFPNLHYVHLTRRNKSRQAISLSRARQTGIWWQTSLGRQAHTAHTAALTFDVGTIQQLIEQIEEHEQAWNAYFSACEVVPCVAVYEEMVNALEPTVRQILDYLLVDLPQTQIIPAPRLQKQADALSEEWVARYQQHQQWAVA